MPTTLHIGTTIDNAVATLLINKHNNWSINLKNWIFIGLKEFKTLIVGSLWMSIAIFTI